MSEQYILIYLLIFLISCLYSTVGHGGASGYLALMTLFSFPIIEIKPIALSLNIIVSAIAFIQFYRQGYFDKKIFIGLAMASIPAAFIGGYIHLDPRIYKIILGILLLLTAFRLGWPTKKEIALKETQPLAILILIGFVIGLISGMIGIGGGIILSPLLIFLGYANSKTTAGISALFIFVNSIAGLMGTLKNNFSYSSNMLIMLSIAILGGFLGSYIGAKKLNTNTLKKVLAVVLLFASIKMIVS